MRPHDVHTMIRKGLLVGAIALVAGTTACAGGTGDRPTPDGPQVAVHRVSASEHAGAAINGVLHGDVASGCLWLSNSSPRGVVATQIVLYGHYTLVWHPRLQVLDDHGRAVATEGSEASFGAGGSAPQITGCPVGAGIPAHVAY